MARRAYHHGNLRGALIKAALDLVDDHGPRGFSLAEAARIAGVSVAAPYRHFADREALLAAVAEDGYRLLRDQLLGAKGRGRAHLEALAAAYVRFAQREPSRFSVMFGAELNKALYPDLQAAADATLELLLSAVAAAIKSGELPAVDPLSIAFPLWSLAHGVATLALEGAHEHVQLGRDPPAEAARITRALLDGLTR